jgi:hypothetical protein
MWASEGVPLWDSVAHPLANALDFAFGCPLRFAKYAYFD